MTARCLVLLAILLSLLVRPVGADTATKHTRHAVIHPALGKFKFIGNVDSESGGYLLKVFSPRKTLLQTLHIDTVGSSQSYDSDPVIIYDVDGDGYKDLVMIDGYGAGPYPSTSLYRYDKASRRFSRDATFPGYNIPTPSQTVGCIYLDERVSSQEGYMFTEWCLSSRVGKWIKGRQCATVSKPACYEEIRHYDLNWHRKHRHND